MIMSFIVFIIAIGVLGEIGKKALYGYEQATEQLEYNLNKQVIINNDTLTIVDYSTWNDTYTLSNGIEINSSFIENQLKDTNNVRSN